MLAIISACRGATAICITNRGVINEPAQLQQRPAFARDAHKVDVLIDSVVVPTTLDR